MGDTETTTDEQLARAVKFSGRDTIEGPVFLFGYRDYDREKFEAPPTTDYCFDWFGKSGRPTLYEHGLDDTITTAVVGRQVEYDVRDASIWQKSELDRHGRYRKEIDGLIERGVLGYSAGAMGHLAKKSRDGTITRFPWVETSLTPTPSAPGNLGIHYVKSADAFAHLEAVDFDMPGPLKAALTALDEWAATNDRDALPGTGTLDEKAGRVSAALDEFRDHARSAAEMRTKSGRALSGVNRDRIAKALASKAAVLEAYADLEALLAETDPEAAAAKSLDFLALYLDTERTLARLPEGVS